MPYGSVNADVIQTSTSGGILGAGDASLMKNRIINGEFKVSQYNGTSAVTPTADAYVIDRFKLQVSQASKLTFQQNAGSVTPPAGFSYYAGITTASAYSIGSGDYFNLFQWIEGLNVTDLGWGTANAKTVTVSFQVRSSLTGTFGGVIKNYDNSRSYPFTYSIPVASTWTTISITIAGDTGGTWNTSGTSNIGIQFGLGVGSTYSGTAGSWASANYISATGAVSVVGTASATWYMTGLQFEVGSSATGFEYRQFTTELQLCQRYYETSYNLGVAPGTATQAGELTTTSSSASPAEMAGVHFATAKRALPTCTSYNAVTGASGGSYRYDTGANVGLTLKDIGFNGIGRATNAAAANATYLWQFTADAEL